MSKIPQTTLRREDFSDVSASWMDRLLRPLNQHFAAVYAAMNHGLAFSDNAAGFTKTIDVTMPDVWTAPTLTAPWASFGSVYEAPAYYKDAGNRIWVRGLVKTTTNIAAGAGAPLWTFPPGYRPAATLVRASPCLVGASMGALAFQVDAGGVFQVNNTTGAGAAFPATIIWASLGFSFLASASAASLRSGFPFRFKNELPGQRRPSAVTLAAAVDITGNTSTPVSAASPAWVTSGDQIVINDVAGLMSGRTYRLTMRVE